MTFVITLILAEIRQRKQIALAVESNGITATLFGGGRTVYSAFYLVLNLTWEDEPVCRISKGTENSKFLKKCKITI